MINVAVLGSTGSVGVNTLEVIASLKDRFNVTALSADSNIDLLSRQARAFRPKVVSVGSPALAVKIKRLIPAGTKVVFGNEGLKEASSGSGIDLVVFAISGSSCIAPLIEAINSRKRIALANKEALVSAGPIIMKMAKAKGVKIVPIDSEHSAIFQCLEGKTGHLSKIYLTGSGGPLLNVSAAKFDHMPKRYILKHPKWRMGRKISIDSATMMNKGLEIIEAKYLFDIDEKNIEVLIHPEAIVHSMVELIDGTIFAQLGVPDMRIPIQYALTYPDRLRSVAKAIDFPKTKKLSFYKPDVNKFPCLKLARQAVSSGGTYPAVLNASDEEAVAGFLKGRIRFSYIPKVIEKVLARHKNFATKELALNDVLKAEEWARQEVRSLCYR